jgi:hypothetical protein
MNTFSVFPRSVLLLAGALVVTATTLSSAPADSRSPVNFTAPSPCGTLSFNAPTDTAIGAEPQILAVGDLDGDGDDDVVTPNYGAQTLTVRLSTGAGFVAAPG